MNSKNTALILIGFQNDYFSKDGILHSAFEDSAQVGTILANTLRLIERLLQTDLIIAATPIIFTPDYSELNDPIGILKIIKDNGAFKAGSIGSAAIPEIEALSDKVITLPGKRGLSCFSNTKLDKVLKAHQITNVLIAGAVTSLCIDTAGRAAADLGYKVTILSDCTVARTAFEQNYYLKEIMPLYANVNTANDVTDKLGL